MTSPRFVTLSVRRCAPTGARSTEAPRLVPAQTALGAVATVHLARIATRPADKACAVPVESPFIGSHHYARQFTPCQVQEAAEDMAKASKQGGYYAVQKGRQTGIYKTWAECEAATKGYAGAVFKKFPTQDAAHDFVRGDGYGAPSVSSSSSSAHCSSHSSPPSSGTAYGQGKAKSAATTVLGERGPDRSTERYPGRPNTFNVFSSTSGSAKGAGSKRVVYCDGSSLGNGKQSARAGWGVYFDDPSLQHLNESRRLPGQVQTNNRAELMALIRAIQLSPNDGRELVLLSDSRYSMDCVNKWLPSWRKNDFVTSQGTPVQNKDLIMKLDHELNSRSPRPKLEYVQAHAGIEGNEIVDRMAKYGASLPASDSNDLASRSSAPESHVRLSELESLVEKKPTSTPW